jgi:bisdemethoxycurcumin synthase
VGILNWIDAVLQLKPEKLSASRSVLHDYGNMLGATVISVLVEMRKQRALAPPQEELDEWGLLKAFGPGITAETMVLQPKLL